MSKITAQDVNKLRKQTGAGMMDCKKALVEAEGDFDKAIDILRKKGQKVAAKRGDRDANEGLVIAKTTSDNKKAVMVVVNCETDFVAKNEDFGKFADTILNIAIDKNPSSLDELKSLSFDSNGLTIADKIIEQTGVIGEKFPTQQIKGSMPNLVDKLREKQNKEGEVLRKDTTADTGGMGNFSKLSELKEAFMVIPDTITESFMMIKGVATTMFRGVMALIKNPLNL